MNLLLIKLSQKKNSLKTKLEIKIVKIIDIVKYFINEEKKKTF